MCLGEFVELHNLFEEHSALHKLFEEHSALHKMFEEHSAFHTWLEGQQPPAGLQAAQQQQQGLPLQLGLSLQWGIVVLLWMKPLN